MKQFWNHVVIELGNPEENPFGGHVDFRRSSDLDGSWNLAASAAPPRQVIIANPSQSRESACVWMHS